MNGDYTKVPLREEDRWTGARMQEGRVLLDHEWNLNLDAAARGARDAVADVVGPAGVLEGSEAFKVGVSKEGAVDLTVQPGRIWVGGLMALAPAAFSYSSQGAIGPLPQGGRALVYLDVFEEHVQPSEAPEELVDPALAPVDSAARTRVGYRLRAIPTKASTCRAAAAELPTAPDPWGTMTIGREGAPSPADPCDPPGDPLGRLPDGLFRVEILDAGSAADARFAWSFENGGACVGVVSLAGSEVTLRPSRSTHFAEGDRVEVSWLERRADRADHGALYTVASSELGAGGDILTLDRAPILPEGATGIAVRRWDGEAKGAAAAQDAGFRGKDIGVRFTAEGGDYRAGDWWGARLRDGAGTGIESRAGAEPDGQAHFFAPLALVDFDGGAVISDCRPTFRSLTGLRFGACTVVAGPEDDLQAAVEALPAGGGKLCLTAGVFELPASLSIKERDKVTIVGTGPATVLRVAGAEAAIVAEGCAEIELREMRIEGGSPGGPPGDHHLNGAVSFVASTEMVLRDCVVSCPPESALAQTCVTVRSDRKRGISRLRIAGNRFEVGAGQAGVLVVDTDQTVVADNHLLGPAEAAAAEQGIVVAGHGGGSVRIVENVVEGIVQGIHVGASDPRSGGREAMNDVVIRGNTVRLSVPASHKRERHAVFVGNARTVEVHDTIAGVVRTGDAPKTGATPIEGIRLHGVFGPFLNVQRSSFEGFTVGVRLVPLEIPEVRLWVVSETLALAGTAVDVPQFVLSERNVP